MYNSPILRNRKPDNPSYSEPGVEDSFIIDFFNFLTGDTAEDKLDWIREKADELNKLTPYSHPLFSEELCTVTDANRQKSRVARVAYNSKSFGPDCHVCGDCFYLTLDEDVRLYLMCIEKNEPSINDHETKAIEAVFWVPNEYSTILVSSLEKTCLAWTVEGLYKVVEMQSRYPLLSDKALKAVESYL